MDKPGDEHLFNSQRCFVATMLIVAAAPRDFWVGRLERLHALPSGDTENGSATTRQAARQRAASELF
jgi:hypothetical protein